MDESLEIKKAGRERVVLLVAKELVFLSQEASIAAIESTVTGQMNIPDLKKWARRVIAIVKEHSV